jgi:hypothetical protein
MKITALALLVLFSLILVGCERDTTQADILTYLLNPFVIIGEDPVSKEDKILNFKNRNSISVDSAIMDYQIYPQLIRVNKDNFCDSMVVLIIGIVNEPKLGILKINEEWYCSSHQSDPLLLAKGERVLPWLGGVPVVAIGSQE